MGSFQALTALWILFAIITFIIMAVLAMYIPHCMRNHDTHGAVTDAKGALLFYSTLRTVLLSMQLTYKASGQATQLWLVRRQANGTTASQ